MTGAPASVAKETTETRATNRVTTAAITRTPTDTSVNINGNYFFNTIQPMYGSKLNTVSQITLKLD